MKKLKIFLLLSILLCFGFALSSEVHAQGGGPKIFEEGDVLPATTQLRISWTDDIYYTLSGSDDKIIGSHNNMRTIIYVEEDGSISILGGPYNWITIIDGVEEEFVFPYTNYDGNHAYCDIDTSTWDLIDRTISIVDVGMDIFAWEDLAQAPTGYTITFNSDGGTIISDIEEATELPDPLPIPTKEKYTFAGWYYDDDFDTKAFAGDPLSDDVILYAKWYPGKLFEVGDVLPATTELVIRIQFGQGDYHVESVDRSGVYISIDWIGGAGDYSDVYIEFGGLVRYDGELASSSLSETYYTIDISNWSLDQRTIKSVSSENGAFATWEDVTPDGYTQGYLAAREEFGYYDPTTDQWLSVSEYLELYGTDKPGASDFYNNFDKYFIPAMIIVFGGAIVLTILKVFKGRE